MKIAFQTFLALSCMLLVGLDIFVIIYSFHIITYGLIYVVPFLILFSAMIFITIKVIEVSCNLSKSFNKDNK